MTKQQSKNMNQITSKRREICKQCGNRGWYFGLRKNPYIKDYTIAPQENLTPQSEPTMIKVCIVCVKCDSFQRRRLRAIKEIEEKDEYTNYPYRGLSY